jgi:hypothetical protein
VSTRPKFEERELYRRRFVLGIRLQAACAVLFLFDIPVGLISGRIAYYVAILAVMTGFVGAAIYSSGYRGVVRTFGVAGMSSSRRAWVPYVNDAAREALFLPPRRKRDRSRTT